MNRNKYLIKIIGLLLFCGIYQDVRAQFVTQASAGSIAINGDIESVRDALNYFSFGLSRELKKKVLRPFKWKEV